MVNVYIVDTRAGRLRPEALRKLTGSGAAGRLIPPISFVLLRIFTLDRRFTDVDV